MRQLIFVLAGRSSRKLYALTLSQHRPDQLLLLSVARFEIRKLPSFGLALPFDLVSRASVLKPVERHFFLTVLGIKVTEVHYIPAHKLGTLREIMALAAWLKMHPQVESLTIISSGFHLPRARLCCRALLPKHVRVKFLPVPNEQAYGRRNRFERICLVLAECLKVFLYVFILIFGKEKPWSKLTVVD